MSPPPILQRPRVLGSKFEIVGLGLILGGEATTFGIVSRMDVRDAMMELPVIVVSQYLRWSSSLMMTFSPSLATSIPYVVLIHLSQKTPSTQANPTSFCSDLSMLMRMLLAARRAR